MHFPRHRLLTRFLVACAAVGVAGLLATPAMAIPAFARKYDTSCTTCHTVFPKLTPFGEAFRRNGYRFPGVDGDYWKIKRVVLGADAYKKLFPKVIWPSSIPGQVPLAAGFNGQLVIHPDKNASAAQADNGTIVDASTLVEEGHIWMGGSFDNQITFFGELTANSEDPIEVEKALLLYNDLVGPKHAVNLMIGHGAARLTSFGAHSTYVADGEQAIVPVTALYGAQSDSFNITDNYNLLELHGVLGGRFDYTVGMNQGANTDVRPLEDVYAHIGYKLGGMRLDGEGGAAPSNPMRPWEENMVTLDLFAEHSNSRFTDINGNDRQDTAVTLGGQLEAQYGSLQLYAGAYTEHHNHATDTAGAVDAFVQYDELSYVVFPWFVPALRVEYVGLNPAAGNAVSDLRIIPAIAMLVRANWKVVVSADIEDANGVPPGGWDPAGGSIAPSTPTAALGPEFENVQVFMMWAF